MEAAPTPQDGPAPRRSPAHRHEIACAAAGRGRALLPRDADRTTRALARYLTAERLSATDGERRALAHRYPGLAAALAIHRAPEQGTAAWLEALALAREEILQVARRSDVPISVVTIYLDCFLSMGPRIDDPVYVIDYVLRPELRRGSPAVARRNAAMKFVAYFSGTAGLEELFGVGRVRCTELWRPLPDVARRVALARDVEALVVAALNDTTGANDGAERLAAIIGRINSHANATVPKNKVARDGARLAELLG